VQQIQYVKLGALCEALIEGDYAAAVSTRQADDVAIRHLLRRQRRTHFRSRRRGYIIGPPDIARHGASNRKHRACGGSREHRFTILLGYRGIHQQADGTELDQRAGCPSVPPTLLVQQPAVRDLMVRVRAHHERDDDIHVEKPDQPTSRPSREDD
jgi:hypothetical protein